MNAAYIILVLKIAVITVTVLLAGSLIALARGKYRLHGKINTVFFVLTLTAVIGLEVVTQLYDRKLFASYLEEHQSLEALKVHLCFSLPAAFLLLLMLATGRGHRRYLHIGLGVVFLVLWTGTFITGIFFLPHTQP
jgi:hypothetical protein